VSGRAGVGKTSLVQEHCRREYSRGLPRYPAGVFWLDGRLTTTILSGLVSIAVDTLGLVPRSVSHEEAVRVALGYLMVAKGWLVSGYLRPPHRFVLHPAAHPPP
jgi:GTPase SAR1 family protein